MSDNLPERVIQEILKRLPVKSLVRCRSVCETWKSLITKPYFISTHLQTALSKPQTNLLLRWVFPTHLEDYALHIYSDDFREIKKLPFPLRDLALHLQVGGHCNGLVFLRSRIRSRFLDLIFWNPSIHKYITLPSPSILSMSDNDYLIYGFGFDSRINDYKLLIAVTGKNRTLREAFLFSLNENSWERVTDIPQYDVHYEKPSTFVNGAAHWVGYQRGEGKTILGFDMSTKEFFVIGLPESLIDSFPMDLSIMKYEESSIAVLSSSKDEPLDLWVMKEYGDVSSWTKVLHFTEQSEWKESVLGFSKNAELLLELGDVEIASRDLESQQMEYLGIEGTGESFVDSYVESLVLLDK